MRGSLTVNTRENPPAASSLVDASEKAKRGVTAKGQGKGAEGKARRLHSATGAR
jgi:hypothetical protein